MLNKINTIYISEEKIFNVNDKIIINRLKDTEKNCGTETLNVLYNSYLNAKLKITKIERHDIIFEEYKHLNGFTKYNKDNYNKYIYENYLLHIQNEYGNKTIIDSQNIDNFRML